MENTKALSLTLTLLIASLLPHFSVQDTYCNNDLLYSYGILSSGYQQETSVLCGNAKNETCCENKAELLALRNWNEVNKTKVKQYMEAYMYLLKANLNFYPFFMERAKEVQNYPGSSEKCKAASQDMIINFKTSSEIFQFIDDMDKVFTQLGFLRKSFYCALCTVENQEYYNVKAKKLTFANTFCHNMVIATIEMFYLRNTEYMAIMNWMNILQDCDPNVPMEEDPYQIEMALDKTDEIALNKCHDMFQKDQDPRVFMEDCTDYCKSYSMTKATEMFEGSFGKLNYLFNKLTHVSFYYIIL